MFNCVISMFNCSQIVTHKQKLTKLKRTSVHQKVQLVNSVALLVSIMIIVTAGHGELQYLEEIGQGAFGRVFKGVWRGSIVAAKEIPMAGNKGVLQNELNVYRSNYLRRCAFLLTCTLYDMQVTEPPQSPNPFGDHQSSTCGCPHNGLRRGRSLHEILFGSEDKVGCKRMIADVP